VIVALDCDFLGLDSPTPLPTKQFSQAKAREPRLNLIGQSAVRGGSQFSITGANADHRLRMKSSDVKQFAMDLAGSLAQSRVLM